MTKTIRSQPAFLDPDRLYSLEGFKRALGISATRMREARLQGVQCPTFNVGRRKFIRGIDGICYVEQLAQLTEMATRMEGNSKQFTCSCNSDRFRRIENVQSRDQNATPGEEDDAHAN